MDWRGENTVTDKCKTDQHEMGDTGKNSINKETQKRWKIFIKQTNMY